MNSVRIDVRTSSRTAILLITGEVQSALAGLTSGDGIVTIMTPHTTCALSVNENADPAVPRDLVRALEKLVPDVRFDHDEGNSDAHLLSMLIGCTLSLPYRDGRLLLGTWQGLYFVELDGPRVRHVDVYVTERDGFTRN